MTRENADDMPAPVQWEKSGSPSEALVQALRDGLTAYNIERGRVDEQLTAGIFVRDAAGRLIGGIYGVIWGSALEIKYLWVDAEWRGQGIGSRLLAEMEEEGRRHGCEWAHLNTYSFQAPAFYQRWGYEPVCAIADGFPPGVARIFLKKRLT
ncbi:MAG: GNAT family N-acetyltransferase [Anaerolineae bacterium]